MGKLRDLLRRLFGLTPLDCNTDTNGEPQAWQAQFARGQAAVAFWTRLGKLSSYA